MVADVIDLSARRVPPSDAQLLSQRLPRGLVSAIVDASDPVQAGIWYLWVISGFLQQSGVPVDELLALLVDDDMLDPMLRRHEGLLMRGAEDAQDAP